MDQIIILGPVMGTQPYPEVTAQSWSLTPLVSQESLTIKRSLVTISLAFLIKLMHFETWIIVNKVINYRQEMKKHLIILTILFRGSSQLVVLVLWSIKYGQPVFLSCNTSQPGGRSSKFVFE